MIQQNILDLTHAPALVPLLPHATTTARGTVDYRPARAAGALVRRKVPGLDNLESAEAWNLEPYRGSEFGSLLEPPSNSSAAKRRILVNKLLPRALQRALDRDNPRRLSIVIGGPFEPYPTAEPQFGITRSILRVLEDTRGFDISITTRSPLVLRDQDLLRQLDMNHTIRVQVPMATLGRRLSSQFEPNSPAPASRLEIVRSLAQDGIAVSIRCGPLLPDINDSADELDPLFAAARLAGAVDVVADTSLSKSKNRRRVAKWLETHAPERADSVLRLLARKADGAALGTLERLRLAYGFPIWRAGRG